MSSYGETIRHEDSIIDLGGVCDEDLFYLRDEYERYLATPGFHSTGYSRDCDVENLEHIEDEIYYRFRTGGSLDEDLPGAYRCGIGCCND